MAKSVVTSKKGGAIKAKKPAAAKTKAVVKKTGTSKKKNSASKKEGSLMRYKCRICGYVYSPLRGEPHNGIPAGTPFEDLPETYLCPVCGFQGKGKVGKWGFEEWRPTRYICSMCDYIYDEKRGEPHRGIKPGTKFEDLPEDYVCPVCATDPKIVLRYGNVLKQGFGPLYE
jgi:rubredoxin